MIAVQVSKLTAQGDNHSNQLSNLTNQVAKLTDFTVLAENRFDQILTVLREGHAPELANQKARLDNHEGRIEALERES